MTCAAVGASWRVSRTDTLCERMPFPGPGPPTGAAGSHGQPRALLLSRPWRPARGRGRLSCIVKAGLEAGQRITAVLACPSGRANTGAGEEPLMRTWICSVLVLNVLTTLILAVPTPPRKPAISV